MKFQLNKPPKHPIDNKIMEKLHPDRNVRFEFYEKVLEPAGHAKQTESGWQLSLEFREALHEDIKSIRALLNLLQ